MQTITQFTLSPEQLASMIKVAVKEAMHSYPLPSKEDALPELLTLQEVMNVLDRSRNTVKNYIQLGKLNPVGKKFRRSEVLKVKHNREV